MDISAVRTALAAAVDIDGLQSIGYLPDSIDPPIFFAGEVQIGYDQVPEGGYDEATIACHLYTSSADDKNGQQLLDGYLSRTGPTSIKAALEADITLGGLCTALCLERVTGYTKYRIAALAPIGSIIPSDILYYGARLYVRVWGP